MPAHLDTGEGITLGAQPSAAMLHALAADGVRAVLSVRTDVEDMQPIHTAEERRICDTLGLTFASVPVSMKSADAATVDAFDAALAALPRPVHVHCKLGQRAAMMVLLHRARAAGWSADEALTHADTQGYGLDDTEPLRTFVREHLT